MNDLGDEYYNQTPEDHGGMAETPVYPRTTPPRKNRSTTSRILEPIVIVFGAVLIALLVQAYLVKPFQIPSESMLPTIEIGDRILVNRLAYRYGDVQRGDIIVFKAPENPDLDFVKRVVAVGGDRVEVINHMVLVNGEAQSEPYINPWLEAQPNYPEQEVPAGHVFVMGDNRDHSDDSRSWGFLNEKDIIGKAMVRYWPLSRIGQLN